MIPHASFPALLIAALLALGGAHASAAIEFAVPNQNLPYVEDGFRFDPAGGGSNFSAWTISSERARVIVSDGFARIVMTRDGGGTFDLHAFDYLLAGEPTGSFDNYIVSSNLGHELVLDGMGSSGTAVVDWIGVTSIEFEVFEPDSNPSGVELLIDNIVIPEPASAAMLAIGGLLVTRRRRSIHTAPRTR